MLYYIITILVLVIYKYNKFIGESQGLFFMGVKIKDEPQRTQRKLEGKERGRCWKKVQIYGMSKVKIFTGDWFGIWCVLFMGRLV